MPTVGSLSAAAVAASGRGRGGRGRGGRSGARSASGTEQPRAAQSGARVSLEMGQKPQQPRTQHQLEPQEGSPARGKKQRGNRGKKQNTDKAARGGRSSSKAGDQAVQGTTALMEALFVVSLRSL